MTSRRGKLVLRERRRAPETRPIVPWPILVVDDDEQVHAMTRVILRDLEFEGRGFEMLSARSVDDARRILNEIPHLPLALIDVVMETHDAGLQLVRHIRDDLGNRTLRIILRTGQPGEAPEHEVVLSCDINDYKSKAELTAQKLFTSIVGALRTWQDLVTIGRLNAELNDLNAELEDRVAYRTAELEKSRAELAEAKARAEAALERETEAKNQQRQFLSMVSHEFRTPLAIIDSAAQMLLLRGPGPDQGGAPRLEGIRGAVQRLIGLIDTCLAEEQLDSGRLVLHEQLFDLRDVLATTLNHYRVAYSDRPVRLSIGTVPAVWGDPRLLGLVMSNLISNAMKYSSAPAPIEISAWAEDDGVALSVRDSGIGIPEAEMDKVFERFYRAANAQGRSGSGIGLHMVRQIMELHGGTVRLDSSPGQGTCATITLRRAPSGR